MAPNQWHASASSHVHHHIIVVIVDLCVSIDYTAIAMYCTCLPAAVARICLNWMCPAYYTSAQYPGDECCSIQTYHLTPQYKGG